ncbi:hypothetical protein F511_05314 [Dorcoceras hygrometricum]|uniref:Uncharacterized protein n=1 Tax=Dorcoceras hygrometricum TaxID=472368 RepID=A0A2Z7CAG2_9LAMI|nr:hypothetical protein F511_05314 [Dorcoceras hygrometricum]
MQCSPRRRRDQPPQTQVDLPAPATLAGAPLAGPPSGPSGAIRTNHGPNRAPHLTNDAPELAERLTPVNLFSLLGSVSHYERSYHGFSAGHGVDPAGNVREVTMVSPLVMELIQLEMSGSHSSHPSSRQPNSLDAIGLDLVVISSRRSQVLVFLVQKVLAVVVSGSSFVANVEESILQHSVLACRVRVTTVCSMETFRECVLLAGSQHAAAPLKWRSGGSSRGRSFPAPQKRIGET